MESELFNLQKNQCSNHVVSVQRATQQCDKVLHEYGSKAQPQAKSKNTKPQTQKQPPLRPLSYNNQSSSQYHNNSPSYFHQTPPSHHHRRQTLNKQTLSPFPANNKVTKPKSSSISLSTSRIAKTKQLLNKCLLQTSHKQSVSFSRNMKMSMQMQMQMKMSQYYIASNSHRNRQNNGFYQQNSYSFNPIQIQHNPFLHIISTSETTNPISRILNHEQPFVRSKTCEQFKKEYSVKRLNKQISKEQQETNRNSLFNQKQQKNQFLSKFSSTQPFSEIQMADSTPYKKYKPLSQLNQKYSFSQPSISADEVGAKRSVFSAKTGYEQVQRFTYPRINSGNKDDQEKDDNLLQQLKYTKVQDRATTAGAANNQNLDQQQLHQFQVKQVSQFRCQNGDDSSMLLDDSGDSIYSSFRYQQQHRDQASAIDLAPIQTLDFSLNPYNTSSNNNITTVENSSIQGQSHDGNKKYIEFQQFVQNPSKASKNDLNVNHNPSANKHNHHFSDLTPIFNPYACNSADKNQKNLNSYNYVVSHNKRESDELGYSPSINSNSQNSLNSVNSHHSSLESSINLFQDDIAVDAGEYQHLYSSSYNNKDLNEQIFSKDAFHKKDNECLLQQQQQQPLTTIKNLKHANEILQQKLRFKELEVGKLLLQLKLKEKQQQGNENEKKKLEDNKRLELELEQESSYRLKQRQNISQNICKNKDDDFEQQQLLSSYRYSQSPQNVMASPRFGQGKLQGQGSQQQKVKEKNTSIMMKIMNTKYQQTKENSCLPQQTYEAQILPKSNQESQTLTQSQSRQPYRSSNQRQFKANMDKKRKELFSSNISMNVSQEFQSQKGYNGYQSNSKHGRSKIPPPIKLPPSSSSSSLSSQKSSQSLSKQQRNSSSSQKDFKNAPNQSQNFAKNRHHHLSRKFSSNFSIINKLNDIYSQGVFGKVKGTVSIDGEAEDILVGQRKRSKQLSQQGEGNTTQGLFAEAFKKHVAAARKTQSVYDQSSVGGMVALAKKAQSNKQKAHQSEQLQQSSSSSSCVSPTQSQSSSSIPLSSALKIQSQPHQPPSSLSQSQQSQQDTKPCSYPSSYFSPSHVIEFGGNDPISHPYYKKSPPLSDSKQQAHFVTNGKVVFHHPRPSSIRHMKKKPNQVAHIQCISSTNSSLKKQQQQSPSSSSPFSKPPSTQTKPLLLPIMQPTQISASSSFLKDNAIVSSSKVTIKQE